MKKILTIIGLVLFNSVLIFIALLLYEQTEKVIKITDAPNGIGAMFFLPIMLLGLIIFIKKRKFRSVGIGLTALCISVMISLFFYLNKKLAKKGEYETFKLRTANWTDNGFFLNIDYNMWYNSTEVTQEKCLEVDSVRVRIDNGFFGIETMTNDVQIVESSNCEDNILDTTNLKQSHLDIGHTLAQKRCFSEAIHHYSCCIALDSIDSDCYYHRGLMFMAIGKYDKALVDFLTSANFKYKYVDNKTIKQADNAELISSTKKLLSKLDQKDYDGIGEFIQDINTINDFDTYQKRIAFCIEKLNEK